MNTDTITAAIQIAKALDDDTSPTGDLLAGAIAGTDVLIRTVTFIYTGTVVGIDAHTIALGNGAWIADTGRFGAALAAGTVEEVEPYPGVVYVTRSSIVDVSPWNHSLPRTVK